MLSACVNKKDKNLDIRFDVPIPASVKGHANMRHFMHQLDGFKSIKLREDGEDSLSGMSLDISEWLDFLKGAVSDAEYSCHADIINKLIDQESAATGDGLKVNFHQRPFDTGDRYWNFIFDQDNFLNYFLNRINWYLCPKYAVVAPFPLHVDIEASSSCNMKCPMCYREMLKETGFMEMETFKKAIDECAAHNVFSVRLSWRGETLTHPRIKEMIAYSAKRIKNVSFLTNAFYLTEDMIDCFIENAVSYIAVSFDGIGSTYEKIRHPAKFIENLDRLMLLKRMRAAKNRILPQVRLCTIWPAIRENPDLYHRTMKDASDYIVCNPYINFKGPMTIKPDFICQYPWERIVISFNGNAQCCTGWNADDIILGNVKGHTIRGMWHSDLMNRIRHIHSGGERMSLNSCAQCRHGSKGDPNIKIEEILERRF